MRRALGLLGSALFVLTSCADLGPEQACTLIGSVAGVRLTVAREIAPEVRGVRLTVCWSGSCHDHPVDLAPGSTAIDQGCDGPGPDAVCSATAAPDGTQVAFIEIPDLPDGEITVSAQGERHGRVARWSAITVPTTIDYPNGPDCGAGAPHARLTLTAAGLR